MRGACVGSCFISRCLAGDEGRGGDRGGGARRGAVATEPLFHFAEREGERARQRRGEAREGGKGRNVRKRREVGGMGKEHVSSK